MLCGIGSALVSTSTGMQLKNVRAWVVSGTARFCADSRSQPIFLVSVHLIALKSVSGLEVSFRKLFDVAYVKVASPSIVANIMRALVRLMHLFTVLTSTAKKPARHCRQSKAANGPPGLGLTHSNVHAEQQIEQMSTRRALCHGLILPQDKTIKY